MPERIRIGVLVCHLSSHYARQLCRGIEQAASQADASVFFFPGSTSDYVDAAAGSAYDASSNIIYQYAAHCCPDVLILSLGSIAGAFDTVDLNHFLHQFDGIPCLLLESAVPNYRCITLRNASGFTALLTHLICDHHFTQIGYVDGRAKNADAVERKRIFLSVMHQYGLYVEDRQIVRGDFSQNSEAAVSQLLNDNPGLEAIVCANDDMALGAYREITRRGLRVGQDIALTGFDDSDVAEYIHPGLTTVHSNTFSLGTAAAEEALRLLRGQPQKIFSIDNVFVQRATCGCAPKDTQMFAADACCYTDAFCRRLAGEFARRVALYALPPQAYAQLEALMLQLIEMLRDTALTEPSGSPAAFSADPLSELFAPELLPQISLERLQMLYNILSEQLMEVCDSTSKRLALMQMLSRVNRSVSNRKCAQLAAENTHLHRSEWISSHIVSDALLLADRQKIYREICSKVHLLGARSCYLYLFDQPVASTEAAVHQNAALSAWYDEAGCHTPEQDFTPLRLDQLIRSATLPQEHPVTAMMFSLFTGSEHHGLLLCEGSLDTYQSLYLASLQAGATLKYLRLLEKQREMVEMISSKNEMLQMLSTQDELTHVLNRRGFLETMQQILREHSGQDAALFYLDLDCLKTINDRFGHEAGDAALRALVRTVLPTLRGQDAFGRMGGDEFIALRLIASAEVPGYLAALHAAFDALNQAQRLPYLINASVGVRVFVCGAEGSLQELIRDADQRLYADKQNHTRHALRGEV